MKMHENLERLAFLDKCAWESFKEIKVEKGPKPYRLCKAIQTINRSQNLSWFKIWNIYLVWMASAVVSGPIALGQVFPSYTIYWALWALFSVARFFPTWNTYSKEYFKQRAGTENPLPFAFGTDNATIFILDFEEVFRKKVLEKGQEYLDQVRVKDFDGLIKLNKAAQDKEEVNLGIGETVKKAAYGGFLLALVKTDFTAFKEAFDKYTDFLADFVLAHPGWLDRILLSSMAGFSLYLIYDLFVGQTAIKRTKKTYLLLLNILKETWVDVPEKKAVHEPDPAADVWRLAQQEMAQVGGLKKIAAYAFLAWISRNTAPPKM